MYHTKLEGENEENLLQISKIICQSPVWGIKLFYFYDTLSDIEIAHKKVSLFASGVVGGTEFQLFVHRRSILH